MAIDLARVHGQQDELRSPSGPAPDLGETCKTEAMIVRFTLDDVMHHLVRIVLTTERWPAR